MIGKVQCVSDSKPTALKQIQVNQREERTEIKKSEMEIQCIKPQISLSFYIIFAVNRAEMLILKTKTGT